MDRQRLKSLVKDYVQDMLAEDEDWRVDRAKPITEGQLEANGYAYSDFFEAYTEDLRRADLRNITPTVDTLLKDKGITDVTHDSHDFKLLALELLKANVLLARILGARNDGDWGKADELYTSHFPHDTPQAEEGIKTGVLEDPGSSQRFSDVVALILEENKLTQSLSIRSVTDFSESQDLFIELMGDIPLSTLNRKTMNQFLEKLKRLPTHRSKRPRYKGLTTAQLLSMDIPLEDRLSATTINKHISWVSKTLSFAEERDMIDKNYAYKIKLHTKRGKKVNEERDAFTKDDLRQLFHSREYLDDTSISAYMFWLPVLGLFTGARLGELCQLDLNDIEEIEGTWVFNIRPGESDIESSPDSLEKKRVKNEASKRIIPICSFLLEDLRLLKYVKALRACGSTRLFPDVPYAHDSYSQYASKWFGKYKVRCGIEKTSKKTFHSFRHTVTTHLKYLGVDSQIIAELDGHTTGSITLERYGKPYLAHLLKEKAIDLLDFGIDLSHLKRSKYVTDPHGVAKQIVEAQMMKKKDKGSSQER